MPHREGGANCEFVWTEDDLMVIFRADPAAGPTAEADLVEKILGDLGQAKQIAAEDAGVSLAWEVLPTAVPHGGAKCRGTSEASAVYYDIFLL